MNIGDDFPPVWITTIFWIATIVGIFSHFLGRPYSGRDKIFSEAGYLEYCVVVTATDSDPGPLRFLAPYSGSVIGNHFRDNGMPTLIICNDLSKWSGITLCCIAQQAQDSRGHKDNCCTESIRMWQLTWWRILHHHELFTLQALRHGQCISILLSCFLMKFYVLSLWQVTLVRTRFVGSFSPISLFRCLRCRFFCTVLIY